MPGWLRQIVRGRWLSEWFRPEYIEEVRHPSPPPPPVLRVEATDGTTVLELHRAASGLYRFEEHTLVEGDEFTGPYLSPTFESGFYATAADAERDARLMLPWLSDAVPKDPPRVDAPRGAA